MSDLDAILDGLRERATGWSCVPLADAVAAVHAAAGLGSPDERLREAGDLAPNEGVWPDQSAMHGVLLEQVKDAYTEGITDTVAKLRVRAANMLPEVASFTMDEIEAILGHAAPGICRAPHCWSEYGTPCANCPEEKR